MSDIPALKRQVSLKLFVSQSCIDLCACICMCAHNMYGKLESLTSYL